MKFVMKTNERRVPRVSRMVLEWFREVPDDLGMVPGVSVMVSGIYEGFEKVMEGSGGVRGDPD